MTVSNWNESARCTPDRVAAPANRDELVAVVLDPEYPPPLRAVGELHSLNECFVTEGTVIFMKHFQAFEYNPVNRTVSVGAGMRMIDLKNKLKKLGLQLEVVPEIGNATAGSVACCGTKDSSLKQGPGQISSCVVAVRMITADGSDVYATQERDPDWLRAIRSSYGLFGVIYEVTFAVQRRIKVKYQYAWVKLARAAKDGMPLPVPDLDTEVLDKADGFLGFLLPSQRAIIVERRTVAKRHPRIPFWDGFKLWLRTFAWTTGARPFYSPFRLLPRRIRRWLVGMLIWHMHRWLLRRFFLKLIQQFTSYRADAMIDFKRPVSSYFDFTFWAFPKSSWAKVVPEFFAFCDDFRRRTGFEAALPTEVYFIRKDDRALLSFCPDEDIYTLDLVNWTDEEPPLWREMNREFNEFAAARGARPLLNQTKYLLPLPPQMQVQLWRPEWRCLSALRTVVDPTGRFLNPFFKEVLPTWP